MFHLAPLLCSFQATVNVIGAWLSLQILAKVITVLLIRLNQRDRHITIDGHEYIALRAFSSRKHNTSVASNIAEI
jgi:hypothetical protein